MKLTGNATPEGTRRYRDRMVEKGIAEAHFREVRGLWVSSIGLGTYLGTADDACDQRYSDAAVAAVQRGCNVFDTAINYRHQRSERALGDAFARMDRDGIASRDEIVVATKGGYIPFDTEMPADPRGYLNETFVEPGLLAAADVVGGMHCMSPRFLQDQLTRSLGNLGLEAVDVYYVHNPEGQLPEIKREKFERRIRAAFETLEVAVAERLLVHYGTATWDGYRAPPEAPEHLDLPRLAQLGTEVGHKEHSFRFVQLPFNLGMPEALIVRNQSAAGGTSVSLLEAAHRAGIFVMASASLSQGQLASGLPPEVNEALEDLESDGQRAIQFVRSTPGISVALVGMSQPEHVEENLVLAKQPPAGVEQFKRLFRSA